MTECKLRSDVNPTGALKQKCLNKTGCNVVVWGIFKDFTRPLTTPKLSSTQDYTNVPGIQNTSGCGCHAKPRRRKGGAEIQLHSFLNSEVSGAEWSTSLPDRFIPAKEPGFPLNTRFSGPRSRSGGFGKRENLCLYRHSNHNHPPVPSHNTDSLFRDIFYTVYIFDNNVGLEPEAPGTQNHNPLDAL